MRIAIVVAVVVLIAAPLASGEIIRSGHGFRNADQGAEFLPGTVPNPTASRANTLLNPGFETGGLPPWVSEDDYWTVTGQDFHGGIHSAEDIGNHWIQQDICPVDVGLIYSISMWSKQPEGVAYQAVDFFYGADDYDEFWVNPGVDWTFIDLTSHLRPSGTLIAIRIWGYVDLDPEDDLTRIDDIVIDTPGGPSAAEVNTWGNIKALYR